MTYWAGERHTTTFVQGDLLVDLLIVTNTDMPETHGIKVSGYVQDKDEVISHRTILLERVTDRVFKLPESIDGVNDYRLLCGFHIDFHPLSQGLCSAELMPAVVNMTFCTVGEAWRARTRTIVQEKEEQKRRKVQPGLEPRTCGL